MDRRHLLTGAAAAVAAITGTLALTEYRSSYRQVQASGHAVGKMRPPHLNLTPVLWRVPTDDPVVALTFDDGPDPRYTPKILKTLEEYGVRATFFLQGSHVGRYPELARKVAEHHALGNHSYNHPDLSLATASTARSELESTHEIIEKVTGRPPTIFRPPYGHFSGATAMIAASMGYPIALWSDSIQCRRTVNANLKRLSRRVTGGAILLGHDGGTLQNTIVVNLLPLLIKSLMEKGLSFVTVEELLVDMRPEPTMTRIVA